MIKKNKWLVAESLGITRISGAGYGDKDLLAKARSKL